MLTIISKKINCRGDRPRSPVDII